MIHLIVNVEIFHTLQLSNYFPEIITAMFRFFTQASTQKEFAHFYFVFAALEHGEKKKKKT